MSMFRRAIIGCVFFTGVLFGCKESPESLLIQVDMAGQHDEGLFNPSAGDRLSLAGNITDWEAGELFLEDENGDWKFTAALPSNTFEEADTLDFKFVITNKENRDLPNSGWEVIPNRQVTREVIEQEQPLFVFNET